MGPIPKRARHAEAILNDKIFDFRQVTYSAPGLFCLCFAPGWNFFVYSIFDFGKCYDNSPLIKFKYSEKATKFDEISILVLMLLKVSRS